VVGIKPAQPPFGRGGFYRALLRRSMVRCLPSSITTSNIPGEAVLPVGATRMGWASLSLNPIGPIQIKGLNHPNPSLQRGAFLIKTPPLSFFLLSFPLSCDPAQNKPTFALFVVFVRCEELATFKKLHQQDASGKDDCYDSHSIPQHDPRLLSHKGRLNCNPLRDCAQTIPLALI
jgi:hypothetical protein